MDLASSGLHRLRAMDWFSCVVMYRGVASLLPGRHRSLESHRGVIAASKIASNQATRELADLLPTVPWPFSIHNRPQISQVCASWLRIDCSGGATFSLAEEDQRVTKAACIRRTVAAAWLQMFANQWEVPPFACGERKAHRFCTQGTGSHGTKIRYAKRSVSAHICGWRVFVCQVHLPNRWRQFFFRLLL